MPLGGGYGPPPTIPSGFSCPPGYHPNSTNTGCIPDLGQPDQSRPPGRDNLPTQTTPENIVMGAANQPCPGGEYREGSSGICRCPEGSCRDIVTGQCRSPGRNEKTNETDDINRPSGGGRGYCRQLDPGARGGGGGGGVPAGRGTNPMLSGIWTDIQKLLNSPSRYTPEVMGRLTGAAKDREAGANQAAFASIDADTARRGVFRSPAAGAIYQRQRQTAGSDFSRSVSDLYVAKVNADAQDKMFAVQMAMQWVGMMLQDNQFDKNLQLAYSRLQQEMRMLQMQLSDPMRVLGPLL